MYGRFSSSEFDLTDDYPSYQGPVMRISDDSPVRRLMNRPSHDIVHSDEFGMGFFIFDDIIIIVIKIIAVVRTVINFIKALIKGELLKALVSLIGLVVPAFDGVFDFAKMGLDFVNTIVDDIAGVLGDVVGGFLDTVSQVISLSGIDVSGITQLDVFDSLSSTLKLENGGLDIMDEVIPKLPTTPEEFVSQSLDTATDAGVKAALDKTPLGKAINAMDVAENIATKAGKLDNLADQIASEGIPSPPTDIADITPDVQKSITESLPNPADAAAKAASRAKAAQDKLLAQGEAQATAADSMLKNEAAALSKEYTSLEERLAAKYSAMRDKLLTPPEIEIGDIIAFFMQFMAPGQKFSDLSADQQAMMMEKLRFTFPNFIIPDFNFNMLDNWKPFNPTKYIVGAAAIAAGVIFKTDF